MSSTFFPSSLQNNRRFNQWLAFEAQTVIEDASISPYTLPRWVLLKPGKVEIGQGIGTALIQIAARELGLDPAQFRLLPATTGLSPDEGVTSGSLSIQDCGQAIRQVCAQVRRQVLASGWSYWGPELTAWLERETENTSIQSVAPRQKEGDLARIDLPPKFAGAPVFIQDLRMPQMQFALVVRGNASAEQRAVLQSDSEVTDMTGVALIEDGIFCAVVALRLPTIDRLQKKLNAVDAQFCEKQTPSAQSGFESIRQALLTSPSDCSVVGTRGALNFNSQRGGEPRHFVGEYFKPWLAHASIGLSCAIAIFTPQVGVRVWTHSQGIYNLRTDLFLAFGERLGMTLEQFVVSHVQGAGCYGHNGADDVAFDAVRVAVERPHVPIRLQWSRTQELGSAPFSPAMLVKVRASLDTSMPPRLAHWQHEVWSNGHSLRPGRAATPTLLGASEIAGGSLSGVSMNVPLAAGGGADRNAIAGYDIPNLLVESHRLTVMPVRSSAFRALGAIANVFAIESMMDEMAASLDEDPYAFRSRHLRADPRALAVLAAAVKISGWQPADLSLGMAYARYKNTGAWCCVVAKVELTEKVEVRDLWIAADVGTVINLDGVLNQLEGGAIQATSIARFEDAKFATDPSVPSDWQHYPIIKFSQVPRVAIELCQSTQSTHPSLGAGEAATAPVIAAIGNAISRGLGARIRRLPFTPETIAQM